MQYEKAYKCYQQALKKDKSYSLALKNIEIIEQLANQDRSKD